jgi:ribonuclease P protein subunit POP4
MSSTDKDKDNSVAKSLLFRAHSPTTATRIFTEKIKLRPLHLKPTEPDKSARNKRLQHRAELRRRQKKLKPQPLTAREKRALGVHDIPKEEQKYAIYEGLHKMWIGYMQEVLGEGCTSVDTNAVAKLVSADFHGAELEVVRSRCVSRVGIKGIVVKDSKFSFQIITKKDELKTVPKEHTMFRFEVPRAVRKEAEEGQEEKNFVFELHGDQFQYRSADRAMKKFKAHFLPDL